ncbi:MAG: sugar transferase [Ardenticatenaceae bacterium]|nr:sugar transferase [Anaerolineales bacterium]MCB8922786.1 sugar transferase [Ardenticatenaceae bacterium]MCB8991919.1 sugar transferase [Ardenticatenaceae bacterium]MCB9004729.1 sugar transferase [Ardenticatenaceae bacterium]
MGICPFGAINREPFPKRRNVSKFTKRLSGVVQPAIGLHGKLNAGYIFFGGNAFMVEQIIPLNQQQQPVQITPLSYCQQYGRCYAWLKGLLDYCLVVPGLLFAAPLMLFIALLVKLDSPGPVIYRRRVLGRNGRIFDAYKFRTMYVNGEEILSQYPRLKAELDRNYKLKCDPRVTRVGTLLRKFSLDELPQLLNVLKRDMSLIGPRIITPDEIQKYGQWGDTLQEVFPGLTGLWQVNGRSNTTYNERVHLDMTYIHNWSIWLDVQIVLRTIPAVLKGDGAY